jgi:predicted DNA-binding ribbon-helix-helix protein
MVWLTMKESRGNEANKSRRRRSMRHECTAATVGIGKGRMAQGASTLVNRNVTIGRRRTSLRLEPAMWDALEEICRREDMSQHELCAKIDARRRSSSLTAAIRVFIVNYFRAAATEVGHASIGHGALYKTRSRTGKPGPQRHESDPV